MKHEWNGYSIEIENKQIKEEQLINGRKTNISDLFFDLLIKYTSEKIHEKPIELY